MTIERTDTTDSTRGKDINVPGTATPTMINYEGATEAKLIECVEALTKRVLHAEGFLKGFAIPLAMHSINLIDDDGTYRNAQWVFDEIVETIQRRTAGNTDTASEDVALEEVQEAIDYLLPLSKHPIMTGQYAKHLQTAIRALQAMKGES